MGMTGHRRLEKQIHQIMKGRSGKLLIGQGWNERDADVFINNVHVSYKKSMPSEDEQKWFSDDPRASFGFF